MSHDDGFEIVYLLAAEEDDEGRLRRATNFDLEEPELASALAPRVGRLNGIGVVRWSPYAGT